MVEGGDAIAGDEEELIAGERVDVTDLAAGCEGKIAEIGLEKGCWHHFDGTTLKSRRRAEWCSAQTYNPVLAFCRLRGRMGAAGKDGFGFRTGQGVRREGIAMLRVEWLASHLAAEKGCEGRDVIDVEINTGIAGSATPGHDSVKQMIADRHAREGVRPQHKGEREQDAGSKEGNHENGCAQGGKPFRGETGEEDDKKLIPCNGEPVDDGIDAG